MNTSRLILYAVAIVAFCAADSAQAGQDRLNAPTADGSPTLKVTSDWLAQTLIAYGGQYLQDSGTSHYSNVGIDNDCVLHWTETRTTNAYKKNSTYIDNYSIPLGAVTALGTAYTDGAGYALQPQSGDGSWKPSYQYVLVYTGTKALISDSSSGTSAQSFANSTFIYLFNSPGNAAGIDVVQDNVRAMAPRIVKALNHAVTLCAGTYQAPAQTNQPF